MTQVDPGHLFVVRGDLRRIASDAVLIPSDRELNLTRSWWDLFPEEDLRTSMAGWKTYVGPLGESWTYGAGHVAGSRHWLFVTGQANATPAWLANSVRNALDVVARTVRTGDGRVRPLVALPLAGTGDGGLEHCRGAVVEALLPVLQRAAAELGIDVALVLGDDRDAAAVQARRHAEGYWTTLPSSLRDRADALGAAAASGNLALFLGAGVSRPLALPDWRTLVDGLRSKAGLPPAGSLGLPEAAQEAVGKLTQQAVTASLKVFVVQRCTLSHALLAGLRVRQAVTTNYDTAYEEAVKGLNPASHRPGLKVLTQTVVEPLLPWLLKLHGDASTGRGIVLTRDQYDEFGRKGNALRGMVQTLLMTSHVLFVGYSLLDETFIKSAREVREVLKHAQETRGHLGTVVPVFEQAELQVRCGNDLDYAPMPVSADRADEGARLLEVFLDRLSWAAAVARHDAWEYLLDRRYADVERSPADDAVRVLAGQLQQGATALARQSKAWSVLQVALEALGAAEPGPS